MKSILTKSFWISLVLAASGMQAIAQTENLDKIIAIVGDKVILHSELETSLDEYRRDNPNGQSEQMPCMILDQFLSQKVLIEQAGRDSVIVSDEEIEGNLENRIRYFVSQYGSEEKLEEIAGKSIYQLKDEYRNLFRDKLTADRMQQSIMTNVKITPQEVRSFYSKIPKDSLPFFPSMLEVGQIVFHPEINKEVEAYAIEKLENVRKDIISGKTSFEVMAGIYSEDPGSKDNAGDLGIMGRDELVPEFAAAAFKLQNGEISPIVKTKFGFHIIQMINRQGEKAKLRHILIKPLITSDMVKATLNRADSVRSSLVAGKMLFSEAVGKYSTDDATKITGGMFTDPQTGGSLIIPESLEPSVALMMNDMKIGEFSQPIDYIDAQSGDKLVRIIYLKNRTEPHRANLTDDYSRIQGVAMVEKQNNFIAQWLDEKLPSFYIYIDEEYNDCKPLEKWFKVANSKKIK
jgi:peptidyl-prolyl cis-trans isomerase SurA